MWSEQRKFMLKHLSDLGMGKGDTMAGVIEQEAEQILERLTDREGMSLPSQVPQFQQ